MTQFESKKTVFDIFINTYRYVSYVQLKLKYIPGLKFEI